MVVVVVIDVVAPPRAIQCAGKREKKVSLTLSPRPLIKLNSTSRGADGVAVSGQATEAVVVHRAAAAATHGDVPLFPRSDLREVAESGRLLK